MRPPEHAVAIVLNSDGRQVGLAFLIGPRELATCAHVVDTALGRKRGDRSTPEGLVRLRLPFGTGTGEAAAAVTGWFRGEDGTDFDLALLTVPPGVTEGIAPLPLAQSAKTGVDVQMCGPAEDGRLTHVRGLLVGRSGQGRLQIDQSRGGAYRVEPGYSGGPVWRQSTGEVVGILRAVAVGVTAAECLDVALLHRVRSGQHPDAKPAPGSGHPIVLQMGGTRFTGEDDRAAEALAEQVLADLVRLEREHDVRPNLLIMCGNLTATARPREFAVARRYISALAEPLGLGGDQIVVVPGPTDVNATLCRAYFEQCRELDEEPVAPYWEKWRPYSDLLMKVTGRPLPRAEPWLAHDLGRPPVIVTALNSTFGATHLREREEPIYGEAQLRWITARAQESGAVPHVVVSHRALVPAPTRSAEIRRAARLVGPVADLILAGEDGVPALDRRGLRPVLTVSERERFHVVALDPERTEVFARRRDGVRFVGDTGTDPDGENWRFTLRRRPTGPRPAPAAEPPPPSRPMENLRLVAEAARLRDPDAVFEVTEPVATEMDSGDDGDGGFAYLRVITRHDFGNGLEPTGQYLLGVLNGPPCRHILDRFHREVVALFRSPGSAPLTRVIYFGKLATTKAVAHGRGLGLHVESFLQFQRGWDPRPFVAWQETDLATDPRYPPQLYVPQDYQELGPRGMPVPTRGGEARPGLPERVAGWLREPYGHLIVVLGAAGSGKTFFLRTLARELSGVDSPVTPIYLPVRDLGRLPEINEVVAAYLTRAGEERLSTSRFEYLLKEGRIALLLDGLDELTALSTYERAIGHLREIGSRAEHLAKIVVTARDVGFLSNTTVLDALGGASAVTEGRRALQIAAFSAEQIEMFLTRQLGDRESARRRVRLISGLGELPEVARNPRMLSFIAAIDERRLIEAQEAGEGQLTGADLYRQVLDQWITGEITRLTRPSQPPPLSRDRLWYAVRALAAHLWRTEREYVTIQDLGFAASALSQLDDLDPPEPEHDGRIHQLGAGSLLVRHEDAELGFIHRSVREWLVADALSPLGHYQALSPLAHHRLTGQAAQFLCEMNDKAAVWTWIDGFSRDPEATQEGRDNALLLQRFAGPRVLSPPPTDDLLLFAGENPQFVATDLSGRDLRDRDLTGSDASYSAFVRTDFTGSILVGTFFTESNLTEATLTLTDLTDAHLDEADLTGADLMGANLTRARFGGARMRRARLLGATMTDVRLHDADLTGAALPGEPLSVQLRPSMVGDVAALDPGGQLVATGDAGGWIRLWELRTGRPVRQWRVLSGPVRSLDWSPDGRRLLVAGHGLGIADAVHGGIQSTRDDLAVAAAAWSPVPGRYALALDGGGVTIESADNREEEQIHLPELTATRLTWSPDGDRLAAATPEGLTVLRPSGDEPDVYAVESPITSLAWSPDGLHVATGHADGRVETWRVPGFRRHDAQPAHTGPVTALAWSADGRHLYSAGSDRRILEWQAWTLTAGTTIPTLVKDVRSLLHAGDSGILVACGGPGTLHAWDLDDDRSCWEGTAVPQWITTASWSPDGRHVLTGASDGELRVWDLSTGLTVRFARAEGSILSADWSRAGDRIITGSDNGETLLWENNLRMLPSFNQGPWVWATRWSPDGAHFAAGGDDQNVRVWSRTHHAPVRRWRVPGRVRSLAWSPDSHHLYIGDATGGLVCRHVRDNGIAWRAPGETHAVTALCVSAAGIILITGDAGDQICIRSAETGVDYDRRTAGHGGVTAISWNDETHTFHTAGNDGRVRVWSTTSYTVVQEWQAHAGAVTSMSLSPDGRHLLTTGRDNVLRVWLADSGEAVATLLPLRDETEAVFYGDGLRYKLTGNTDGRFWYACAQVRLEAGEADEYVHELDQVPEGTPLL